MARTAIPVFTSAAYQEGVTVTATAGDAALDHQVDLSKSPRLHLMCYNGGAPSVSFDILHASASRAYNEAVTTTITVTGTTFWPIVLDVPSDMWQSGDLLHIDSADGNFSNMNFWAYTWIDTPQRR